MLNPAAQLVQLVEPSEAEIWPIGQALVQQDVAPEAVPYQPAGISVDVVAPVMDTYEPGPADVHEDEPALAAYLPAGHVKDKHAPPLPVE